MKDTIVEFQFLGRKRGKWGKWGIFPPFVFRKRGNFPLLEYFVEKREFEGQLNPNVEEENEKLELAEPSRTGLARKGS